MINTKEHREVFYQESRYFKLYKSGIEVFKNYPTFGVGNKNYRIETCNENKNNENYDCLTHPHQVYIELLAEHGLLGTSVFLILIFYLIFKNFKIYLNSQNSIQLGSFIYLLTNFLPLLPSGSFFSDFNSTLFWINLSIMYACNKKTNFFQKK
jgi:O-antigen ligase